MHNRFLRVFILVIVGLLLGSLGLLFFDRTRVPAKAQAQDLFTLYFEMDHVRQDSARIFAGLMVLSANPARAGAVEAVGSKPPLPAREELYTRLMENRHSGEEALAVIDGNKFTDPDVHNRYAQIRAFYTDLFAFEDMLLSELSLAENNAARQSHLATTLFEGSDWPALLAQDALLRDTLTSLAGLHGLEFVPLPYEDLFRKRLVELDTPLISDEVNTIVHPFTVAESTRIQVVLSISFDIKLSDKMQVSLEDPRGRIITLDQLRSYGDGSEANRLSFVTRDYSVIAIKLFPDDPLVMPLAGDWKLYVTAPVGCTVVIGMVEL